MICRSCGTELPDTALFCGECGRSLASERTGAVTVVPVPIVPDAAPEPVAEAAVDDAAEQVIEPEPESAEPEPEPEPDPEPESESVEATRVVPHAPAAARFILQFSTGESVAVTGTGLIGRNPSAEPGEFVDHLVPIVDGTKSVSKTHVEFGQADGNFWISDRFSGNGTTLAAPEDRDRYCEPGKRYRAPRGSRVNLGDQFFIVS